MVTSADNDTIREYVNTSLELVNRSRIAKGMSRLDMVGDYRGFMVCQGFQLVFAGSSLAHVAAFLDTLSV